MSNMDRLKQHFSEIRLPSELTKLTQPGSVSFVSDPSRHVLENNVGRLALMPAPRGADRLAWKRAVEDAARLVTESWAETAISLNWSALDLFGVEPLDGDDDYANGLAVWLAGRPIVLLDADSAIIRVGERRSVFNRKRDRSGCVLLWEIGR